MWTTNECQSIKSVVGVRVYALNIYILMLCVLFLYTVSALCLAEEEKTEETTEAEPAKADEDVGKSRDGSKTDDEVVEREEEAIKLDGLNVAQMKELREKAEKFTFQAEVNRMMKLIINSLYRNKEVHLNILQFVFVCGPMGHQLCKIFS